MKLFKHSAKSKLYQIHELTEDQLIAFYNVCLNYKGYLSQLTKLPDDSLLQAAPGSDVKVVRQSLNSQMEACDDYIKLWDTTINKGKPNKFMN